MAGTRPDNRVSLLLTADALENRWYVTPSELATLVPLSEWTIRKAIYEGEMKAVRIRRRWLIEADEAKRWIEKYGETNVA